MKLNVLPYLLFAITAMSAMLAVYHGLPRASARRALRWLLAGMLASPVANAAIAIYQCDLNGRTSYQDIPCDAEATTIRVMPILKPTEESVAAAGAALPDGSSPPTLPSPTPKSGSQSASATSIEPKPRIERVEQTQFNRDKRTVEVRRASAECQGILEQIAAQKELMRSLRAESRSQARSKVGELSRDLRSRC